MGVLRYLGGVGSYLLGGFFLLIGIIGIMFSPGIGLFFIIIGFVLLLVGKFYAKTAMRYTQVEMVTPKKKFEKNSTGNEETDYEKRYCPACGRVIPFDANICPYCGKKFEVYQ